MRHAHRHVMSRRNFFAKAAGATAAALTSNLWMPSLAYADAPGTGIPNPIPHVTPGPFGPLHFFFPGPADASSSASPNAGHDPSIITDFNGFIGVADVAGTAVARNTQTGVEVADNYTTDSRFMIGEFVDTAGRNHHGAFAFI